MNWKLFTWILLLIDFSLAAIGIAVGIHYFPGHGDGTKEAFRAVIVGLDVILWVSALASAAVVLNEVLD